LIAVFEGVEAIVCFACSGKTDAKTTSGTTDSTETELGAKLTIPVGAYAGCMTNLVGVRPHVEGGSGGEGTVTVSVAGDGTLNAALSFGQWLSGTVAFAATSGTTAGLGAGPFEIEMFDPTAPADSTGPSNISVSVAAGTLVLAGDTLFISVYGRADRQTPSPMLGACSTPYSVNDLGDSRPAPPRPDTLSGGGAA
jgi:hypothetical protein